MLDARTRDLSLNESRVAVRVSQWGHFSPVDFKSNPEISCLNRQDKPLDRKFSALYDGISCQFVGVEQFSQSKKL